MSQQQPVSTGNRLLRGVVAFFRFLLRLIFVLVLAVLLGVGLYYGAPWAYRNLVQPVQDNAARIAALEHRVEQEQARLQEENRLLQERIAALETTVTQLREEVALQGQAQQEAAEQVQSIEDQMAQLEATLMDLRHNLDETKGMVGSGMGDLKQWAEDAYERLNGLEGRFILLQAAQDLLKAQLLLSEENLSGARNAISLAADHLDQAAAMMPEQEEELTDLQERLGDLDTLIANRSFRALPELESVWAALMEIATPPSSQRVAPPPPPPTPTMPPIPTPTPTPTS